MIKSLPRPEGSSPAPARLSARRRWLLLVVASLLIAAPAVALTVTTEFAPGADFAGYREYSWIAGRPAADSRIEATIRTAIDKQLQRKGYRKVENGGDILVATEALRDPLFSVGLLQVLIFDSARERVVFRGRVSELIEGPSDAQKKVPKAIKQVFKPFPKAAHR